MQIQIAAYDHKDKQLYIALMESCGWTFPNSEEASQGIATCGGTVLLASVDDEPLPVGFCRLTASPFGDVVWIQELCVRPHWQHQGVGKRLIEAAATLAGRRPLVAWAVDAGPTFFPALGFRQSTAPVYFQKPTGEAKV